MGCTGSKQHPNPSIRSQSLPLPLSHSLDASVTLTSSTLGSLDLSLSPKHAAASASPDSLHSWSDMIDRHCPSKWAPLTPTMTPPNEPEVINVWELMQGLEDVLVSPLHPSSSSSSTTHPHPHALPRSKSPIRELDPDLVYAFLMARKEIPQFTGLVRQRIDAFQQSINARRAKSGPPAGDKRVVLYLTSLRGVRQTFEDCWDTKVILQTYGVLIDERDVAMHAGYKEELRGVLGEKFTGKLPQVFADGRHLGGAEEVRRMHEKGQLGKALGKCESVPVKKGGSGQEPCSGCGGMRFVPCEACSGSCKVFSENGEEGGGFARCKHCNENGLIRCPLCCCC